MLYDYRFMNWGIELEFSYISRKKAANIVASYFNSTATYIGGPLHEHHITDEKSRVWKIVKDNAIRPERLVNGIVVEASKNFQVELVSPPLQYTDIETVQNLVTELKANGSQVPQENCGCHVHIEALDFNAEQLTVLCNTIYEHQDLLEKALNIHQPRFLKYCKPLTSEFIERLNYINPSTLEEFADIWYYGVTEERLKHYNPTRYQFLNCCNLLSGRQPTIEYRLYNSILDENVVKAYIHLSLRIISNVLNDQVVLKKSKVDVGKDSMHSWLAELGMLTDEFAVTRYHLTKNLQVEEELVSF